MRSLVSLLACTLAASAALAAAGCDKSKADAGKPAVATVAAGSVGADGVRRVPVQVGQTGYTPDRIEAKGGERLALVFTRTADTECGRYVKVEGAGDKRELPLDQPVEIAVTVPPSGEVKFACGMDMMTGVVIVKN